MPMLTFQPELAAAPLSERIETGLFLGVRADPALESTQVRWQVRISPQETVELETGEQLGSLGGALFLTTRDPKPETPPGEEPGTIGWILWIGDAGRRSFQIQLAISRAGFDRVCDMALQGRYPHAILTFKEEDRMATGNGADDSKTLWKNVESKIAVIAEFTLRYDLARPGLTHTA